MNPWPFEHIPAAYLERDELHAQSRCVELDSVRHTFDSQHQMVQMTHFDWTRSLAFNGVLRSSEIFLKEPQGEIARSLFHVCAQNTVPHVHFNN